MKPTPEQVAFLEDIKYLLSCFQATSDLSSPTHHSDTEEEVNRMVGKHFGFPFIELDTITFKKRVNTIANHVLGILDLTRSINKDNAGL